MNKILDDITTIINTYEGGEWQSVDALRELSRSLSSNMYYLTKINIESFNKWNGIVFNSEKSNAAAKVEADFHVPELRLTRKILEAARGVSISINSELKIISNE